MAVLRDVRYALHTLRTSPGYALMCVGVLALGIGANAAIFSVLNSVVFDALPYPNPDQLVFLWQRYPGLPAPVGDRMKVSRFNFDEWKRQATSFSAMEAYEGATIDEPGTDAPVHVKAAFATAGLFPMLGVRPRIGRLLASNDDRTAVISDLLFDERFHRDRGVLGRTLNLGGAAYTIIGVLPPRFHVPSTYEGDDQVTADVWMPLSRLDHHQQNGRLFVPARLKPGVTLAQARAEMERIAGYLRETNPKEDEGWHSAVFPVSVEDTKPAVHRALYVLMGAVGFLLLIACANLANLTLARAAARSREIAVRLALGATPGRIVAQLITEALVVSLAGAALGLVLARWAVRLMIAFKPEDIQRPELIAVNLPVFGFAAGAAVLTTILFGLVPSLGAARANLATALKTGGRGGTGIRVRSRQVLIAVEVALALMLVSGAALMIRSFREVVATGIGIDTTRITCADIDLPEKPYPDDASRTRFYRALIERVQSLPGVAAAAVTDTLPLHSVSFNNFLFAGRPDPPLDALPIADQSHVSPGYFRAIGLRLEAGRPIDGHDLDSGHDVVAVNRAFVAKFFPTENPLGKVLLNADHKHPEEIVAIVSDYRALGTENGNRPTVFHIDLNRSGATLLARGSVGEAALRNAVRALDPTLRPERVGPMTNYVDEWLSQRRFNTLLLEIFAGLALVLGMMGIYGVLANLVASRTREIGIRMAVGATPGEIARMVLRQSMTPVGVGLAAGLAGSLVLSQFLESLLYQVRPRDPLSLVLASCVVLAIAPAAILVPLRRATRVDCTVALREE